MTGFCLESTKIFEQKYLSNTFVHHQLSRLAAVTSQSRQDRDTRLIDTVSDAAYSAFLRITV